MYTSGQRPRLWSCAMLLALALSPLRGSGEELPPFYRARGYVERGQEPFDDPFATRPAHYILMGKELAS